MIRKLEPAIEFDSICINLVPSAIVMHLSAAFSAAIVAHQVCRLRSLLSLDRGVALLREC